ncbi:uncharacterized protein BDR25DRAFT_78686 [Lindgomyces ingoldianus]|uniref:Uncharacterized protein n=1 Tax=Lindgomyces ingoldianus TaxID=673940 RepID=A0ACB6QI88_9PLEO|nr:uncharacterized protein BDR25DRAFT_78686 [Lindgomyces ingoldianus]KAF2466032.1 hypothetical protein BDR25DRAFT_78686 [Lindgomyces ingoldianus]
MAIQQRQQTASIYLTFKVIQLVNQLRRRLKPRVLSPQTNDAILGSSPCLGLETKALKSLERGLSRISGLQHKQLFHHSSNRVCKSRKNIRPSPKPQTSAGKDPTNQNPSRKELQHVLESLDGNININPPDNALSAIAGNDKLFLKQNDTLNFEPCSLKDIISNLALVHEGLRVLYTVRSQYDDQWLIAQGLEIGLSIDEAFIANYEHLLLRLQTQLVDVLTRKVIEALIEGNHDKRQRRLLNWFFEYSGNRRPLSTTWPWSIKPSLAVLWGVCWMFYDNAAPNGSSRVPQARFLQDESFQWRAPQPNQSDFNYGLELTGTQSAPEAQQNGLGEVGSDVGDLRHLSYGGPHVTSQHSRSARNPGTRPTYADRVRQSGPIPVGIGSTAFPSPTTAATYNNYASGSHASASIPSHDNNFSPQHPGIPPTQLLVFPQLHVDSTSEWSQFYDPVTSPLPQRHRNSSHLNVNPVIQVTADASGQAQDNASFAQPHPDFSPFIYQRPAPRQPQAQQLDPSTNITEFANSSYTMGNCPPDASPIHTTQVLRHERTVSNNSNSNMPTPVSIAAPHSPLRSPIGDRRPSIGSSIGHARQDSEERSSQDGDDNNDLSPRRNHAYKRSEEPPRNREGKMVCKHKECADLTFDRKCEWSKHMDKHDRPYKCIVRGCEKLQGFTYSGGLLRHEREVHKMHGGTKKSLFCPFPDCKRSSGSGFTRKENLAEHIRRVHRRTSTSSDLGNLVIPRPESQDGSAEVHLADSPYQRISELPEDLHLGAKRKRMASDAGFSDEGDEHDLRAEVKRLRKENEEKNARLRQLEAAVMALQQSRR